MSDTGNKISLSDTNNDSDFLIVGIGASAGGIQALKIFFENVSVDSGMAYVVILHLSPDHDSRLSDVIRMNTKVPVSQVLEKTKVVPNHIYVVPPNKHLSMEDGHILVSPNVEIEDRRAPVDIFFRTLANSNGPRAVCVVLSGTCANGSMGLKRVKEMGGAAFVQSPREAEFNEMPRNSISTDMVDAVLPVAEIPGAILSYKKNQHIVHIPVETENRQEGQQNALKEIFTQLRILTGHDFSNYKRPTLLRRIERRINVRNLPDLQAYSNYLQEHAEETNALLKDLLISVTNFFRDKKAFEALELEILPTLIKNKNSEEQVRIWVAGCATGEEAYAIAMLCAEQTLNIFDAPKILIFATDIDEEAIAHAREGFYTINEAADVSPERLRRFFNREGDGYRIRRELREMLLFANHNFIKDPPFSHLDLISCRNVLIYLNRTAQERVMQTFHFALNTGGYLFLGTSESVDTSDNLYEIVSRDHHIFKSRPAAVRAYPVPESVPPLRFDHIQNLPVNKERSNRMPDRITYGDLHQQLLEQYAAPSLIVDEEYEIVHMSQRVGAYLQFSGGEPSQNLLKVVKPELRLELRSALYQATQQKTAVEAKGLKIKLGDKYEIINIHIRPAFREDDTTRCYILVIFESTEVEPGDKEIILRSDESVSRHLEEELIRVKAQLRSSTEQHEFQAEELKASNEELQAMNEELRSSAEELETSKEELQSMNEELRTVNQELKVKIEETSLNSNNLQNLINSADIGTIFLDRSFRIALFTPSVRSLFNLIPNDIGRPLSDITHKLSSVNIVSEAEYVLEKLQPLEHEVHTIDNRLLMMRILPYRTDEDRINGIIITFFDITERRQNQERLKLALDAASMGTFIWHAKEDFIEPDAKMLELFDSEKVPLTLKKLIDSMIHTDDSLRFAEAVKRAMDPEGDRLLKEDVRVQLPGGAFRWLAISAQVYFDGEPPQPVYMAGVATDISSRKALEQQKDDFISIASHELKTPVTSIKVYTEVMQENFEKDGDLVNVDLVKKLNGQVDRLNNLINDLLDTTKISEGKLILRKQSFDINHVIKEQVGELQRISSIHRIIFAPAKLKPIYADKERITQVLTNLISNAIKYSPNGGEINITTASVNGGIEVVVRDRGVGIPSAKVNKVFDKFFRVGNPKVNTYPGMGLGLFISAGIIERHGGTISVDSKEKEGSVFSFTLPYNNDQK